MSDIGICPFSQLVSWCLMPIPCWRVLKEEEEEARGEGKTLTHGASGRQGKGKERKAKQSRAEHREPWNRGGARV